jgi:hypothetical protein
MYKVDLNTNVGTVEPDGYKDPKKVFPRRHYMGKASTNFAARGIKRNNLYIGGGHVGLDLGLREGPNSKYPKNQVRESISGHVTEIDDTPGNERMLFKHKTGSGVEMRADGTVIISSTNHMIRISAHDEKVIVEGNGEIFYNGNLKLNVAGDFDLNVGGNFNVTTGGDKTENIKGGYRQTVTKNKELTTIKNSTEYVAGSNALTTLGNNSIITKGTSHEFSQGDKEIFVGSKSDDDGSGTNTGVLKITGTDEVFIASDNINILANDLSATGNTGDIGGENVIMHNYSMYTGHHVNIGETLTVPTIRNDTQVTTGHMNIPVVYGDLQGTAHQAITADITNSQNYADPSSPGGGVGAPTGYTVTQDTTADQVVDPFTRTRVNADEATSYLHTGDRGTRNVQIDITNDLKDAIDKTTPYGGLSSCKLTTPEIRSKMRDPKNARNEDFTAAQATEGKLAAMWINKVAPEAGRIVSAKDTKVRGKTSFPNSRGAGVKTVKT